MSKEINKAIRCRNYAEELRAMSQDAEVTVNRNMLQSIATAYDLMAEAFERIANSKAVIQVSQMIH